MHPANLQGATRRRGRISQGGPIASQPSRNGMRAVRRAIATPARRRVPLRGPIAMTLMICLITA